MSKGVHSVLFLSLVLLLMSGCASFQLDQKALYDKGYSLANEKRFGEALQVYRTAVKIDPKSSIAEEAQYQIGYTLVNSANAGRDYDSALREFNRFLEQYPRSDRAPEVSSWVLLLSEYNRLVRHIQDLNELDIELEKKRRQMKQ